MLFDRSWYNRAGVERVMGFCSEADIQEFFRSVTEFERMLVRSGIILIKYWFSITDEEQNLRFQMRIHDPLKQWKLSPMDLESRRRWEEYTKAKEEMLERTHIPEACWWVVEGNDKKKARLNCIHHLLQQIPYRDVQPSRSYCPSASTCQITSVGRNLKNCTFPASTKLPIGRGGRRDASLAACSMECGHGRYRYRRPWATIGIASTLLELFAP